MAPKTNRTPAANIRTQTAEEVAAGWQCRKRDGSVVGFDVFKIKKALYRCFHAEPPYPTDETGIARTEAMVESITKAVINTLAAEKVVCPEVETVQRYVIRQLWAEGLFDAAEHYQNYREARRQARLGKEISPEVAVRIVEDQTHFPSDLQYYQYLSKFARWSETAGRRETWKETIYDRVMPWFRKLPEAQGKLTGGEWQELADAAYNLEASPAMRVVQMAGPALDRCHIGTYNCAYQPLADQFAFAELLYVLMQGTGEGFSCESDYVGELPRIKKQKGLRPDTIRVEDDTEGWCNAYHELLKRLWDGHDLILDTSLVRPKGARLKTKGGRASGPEPLQELAAFARNLVKSRQGRFFEDIDAHDLGCMTGRIVAVGGVRRAAEISLSDLDSAAMRNAKAGNWYEKYVHRTMANNSAVYDFDGLPPVEVFMEEWLSLTKSKSGERGIFNRKAALAHSPKRRKWGKIKPGCNPCAEILLRPYGLCNLTMAIARVDDTVESLKRKVRIATIFGKLQSLCTNFRYVRPEWKKNCEEERLLGVDITGQADCPLLRYGTPGRDELLRELGKVVETVDIEFSVRFNINRSAAATTVKPGGDSAVLFDCSSGISPRFSAKQVRWVRETKTSPIARFLVDSGVPHALAPEAPDRLLVFGFPKVSPHGATLRNDLTAIQQLENWLTWKREWAEHSVSATIYVDDHEWPEVGAWVYKHFDHITGLSFLPKDNGIYSYAPNVELSDDEYEKMVASFPKLDWSKLSMYESDDQTEASATLACVAGGC